MGRRSDGQTRMRPLTDRQRELKHEVAAAAKTVNRLLEPARMRRLLINRLLESPEEVTKLIVAIGTTRLLQSILESGLPQVMGNADSAAERELVNVREQRALLEFYLGVATSARKDP